MFVDKGNLELGVNLGEPDNYEYKKLGILKVFC